MSQNRRLPLLTIVVFVLTGCAIHYYDSKTGAEHIWGVGHIVMKAPPQLEGHRALIRGTEVIGFAVGNVGGQGYLTVGWEKRQRLDIVGENTSIRLEWPTGDLLNVRVGSEWSHFSEQPTPNDGGTNQ